LSDIKDYEYTLVYKTVLPLLDGKIKGNCDAEIVLHAMIIINNNHKAVVITGDGDIACLVDYLRSVDIFKLVIACRQDSCSHLLRKAARCNIMFIYYDRWKFEKQKGQL